MDCSVCKYKDISPLVTHCPNCGAELVSTQIIDSLEEKYLGSLKGRIALEGDVLIKEKRHLEEKSALERQVNRLIVFILLLPLLSLLCNRKELPIIQEKIIVEKTSNTDSLTDYKNEIDHLTKELNALQAATKHEVIYITKEGDMLRDLGKLFFNDWEAGYQIGKDNGVFNTRQLPTGDTLVIKFRYSKLD